MSRPPTCIGLSHPQACWGSINQEIRGEVVGYKNVASSSVFVDTFTCAIRKFLFLAIFDFFVRFYVANIDVQCLFIHKNKISLSIKL